MTDHTRMEMKNYNLINKWNFLIISFVGDKGSRFTEIKYSINGLHSRILSKSLKNMRDMNMIYLDENSRRYMLTKNGFNIKRIINDLFNELKL
ncbi:winged helix-turn-helix transcriptional regulator [Gluconobacter wancherniae]|nr:winged helix-turn-helix transcriptional regulator [Gluconobacter wancherniae]